MTRKTFGLANPRQRGNRRGVRQRLNSYPLSEWLVELEPDAVLVATQDEDFPTISRGYFVQDLHRLAREATQRAKVNGEEQGWIVRTTTKDLPDNELAFVFYRAAFEDCPQALERDRGVATPEADPDRQRAWHEHRTAAYYCITPERGTHVIGQDSGCAVCPGRTPELLPENPPIDWSPTT